MLVLSAILSLGLIAFVYFAYRGVGNPILGGMLLGTACALFGACLLPALFLHALFIMPALGLWNRRRWPANALLGYMILAGVVSYGYYVNLAMEEIAARQRLRQQYAFESMEARLPVPRIHAAAKPATTTLEHLTALEKNLGDESRDFRTFMLERLHQDNVQSFIDRPGFGVQRTRFPTDPRMLPNLDREGASIPQPGLVPSSTLGEGDLREPSDVQLDPLREMHASGVLNFVYPRGFGLIKSRQKVAGFQSHRFNEVPSAKQWKVQSLELVGLLMHAAPVVYVSDELPRMEKLRQAPTRSLNTFEAAGIARLQLGDDLFVRETLEGIRMLGAVRSVNQCLKCHGGERGDLLGAFSYSLQRVP